MPEKLTSFGVHKSVEIFRCPVSGEILSGIVFSANGMYMTARHVVDNRQDILPGFEVFPVYDEREVDFAIKKDASLSGMELGFNGERVLENCVCLTSRDDDPENIILVKGTYAPFYAPTYLYEFIPDDNEQRSLFDSGCSGSAVIYGGHVVGLIKASNEDQSIVVGLCFNHVELRKLLADHFGLDFREIPEQEEGSQGDPKT